MVSFHLAVVAGCVGSDELVASATQDVGEVFSSVAGAVIGDDALDV